jgi:hypothetical protein
VRGGKAGEPHVAEHRRGRIQPLEVRAQRERRDPPKAGDEQPRNERPSQLLTTNDRGLNVDLLIPLGLAIALFPNSRLKTFALALAFILPVAIETSQAVITTLNRACQLQDVVDNLSGLTIGALIGSIALVVAERAGFNPRPLGQTE